MHIKTPLFLLALTCLNLAACETTTQMTSGAEYLSRYQSTSSTDLDLEISSIAAVEPNLHFPARIGLARIERGQLTTAPADEMMAWARMAEDLGAPYGEIVPVSPFIANMVRPASTKDNRRNPTEHVVADIRRASARQHLDSVLVYEVTQNVSKDSNALALADLTILGLYVLPSRSMKIDSTASAILIDVRNGYPYGTATAFASAKRNTSVIGSGAKQDKARANVHLSAVENLTQEVETMMEDLWVQAEG